jgi:hypothetical protein
MRSAMYRSTVTVALIVCLPSWSFAALAADCMNQKSTASDVADMIDKSPNANDALKGASCDFGGAAMAESGGNSCASNGNNFGVLQLTKDNLPAGMTPEEYLALSSQEQVDIWAQQVGVSNASGGYGTLSDTLNNAGTIGGATPTAGMLAGCFQFGPLICQNDIDYMNANGGQCPSESSEGVKATKGKNGTLADGTANLDGNGHSICSWGKNIQLAINDNAKNCKANCPGTPGLGGGDLTPSPTDPTLKIPSFA